jgi:hypothetical protein
LDLARNEELMRFRFFTVLRSPQQCSCRTQKSPRLCWILVVVLVLDFCGYGRRVDFQHRSKIENETTRTIREGGDRILIT